MEGEFKVVAKTSSDPVYWLDRLASIYRNLNVHVNKGEPHPCQSIVTYTWPSLSAVLDKFQTERRVMERCCRCLRFALRLIGHQSAPLLQPLVTQVRFPFFFNNILLTLTDCCVRPFLRWCGCTTHTTTAVFSTWLAF